MDVKAKLLQWLYTNCISFFFMKNSELFQMLEVHEYNQNDGNEMKSVRSQWSF